jgi:hypothetical protein
MGQVRVILIEEDGIHRRDASRLPGNSEACLEIRSEASLKQISQKERQEIARDGQEFLKYQRCAVLNK